MNASLLAPALAWSSYLRRRLHAKPELADWLANAAQHPVTESDLRVWQQELSKNIATGTADAHAACRAQLRQLRERAFCVLIVRDLAELASFQEVTHAMTNLADLAVAAAYRTVAADLAEVHGVPVNPATGLPQEMIIVGMGKLGGGELNVSSDIDLITLYGAEGETDGRRKISHHEFYCKLTRRMMPMLSEPDADGYVFRTDLRLRPDGDAGPPAWSLGALEHYLVTQGREWERYAWLKARTLPVRAFADSQPDPDLQTLEGLRRPFVYRKYFDFDALAALRGLRERIRLDWERRALARSGIDSAHNIKLGEGGIREIEFVVQLNQLIRGGRMPTLQVRGLLPALYAERAAGLLSAEIVTQLEAAYLFLRRTEHFLQYREDEQTHLLPGDPAIRAQLAEAMGRTQTDFEHALAQHRAFVHEQFRNAFRIAGIAESKHSTPQRACAVTNPDKDGPLVAHIRAAFGDDSAPLIQRVESLLASHRMRSLPTLSQRRVEALLPAAVQAASQTDAPLQAAPRLFDLIERIAQRSAYLALLAEYPDTLARVARMMVASAWAAHYLTQHPLLLDTLIDSSSLLEPLDFTQISQQLGRDLDACLLPDGQADIERQMDLMRDVQRQTSFQLLAQDLAGQLTVEELGDQLSALADMLLAETVRRVWPLVRRGSLAQDEAPSFAVISYGKLGGKELGYDSDLDIIFLYDDTREDAPEVYTRLGRRMTSWLSTMTASGRLYDVDLRLRPDGDAGLLAVSVHAFDEYQRNHAWLWEHQALTRARYSAGDAQVGQRFEAIRRDILMRPKDPDTLLREVRAMRERIFAGHPNPTDLFDIKHDRGGMVDVEFVTQYLVLRHAPTRPELVGNLGNIALLRMLGDAAIIPCELARQAGNAYRSLRRSQHKLRLQGAERARVSRDELVHERTTVQALWNAVLG